MIRSAACPSGTARRGFFSRVVLSLFGHLVFVGLMALSWSASARTYAVVVAGLGGTEDYALAFSDAAESYSEGLLTLDSDESLVITLSGEAATRDAILQAISDQAARMQTDLDAPEASGPTEPLFVLMLVGHGNADKDVWRFNVTGPDISSGDLIAALNAVPVTRQLVVLAASASGAALDSMSQLGRVLVTATKSGGEINAIRFHGFLAEALASDIADYDRNEILTIAEAYRFASARTTEYYEQQNLLASEHSRLRGELADDFAVALLGSLQDAREDPVVSGLLEERMTLERRFKLHKARKAEMPVSDYYEELEELLISIARLQRSIDDVTGWSERDADS